MRCSLVLMVALSALPTGYATAVTLTDGLFRVHVSEGGEALAEDSLILLRQALTKYEDRLPAGDAPIDIFIARSYDEFQRFRPPPGRIEGFANSRAGRIAIKGPRLMGPNLTYDSVLRHELLHVLLARNSAPGHLPRWLNEGIAMMLSRENRWSSMFRVARMYGGGRVIDYDSLSFAFAAPGNEDEFGDAYAQSLSMTKFLRDKMGEEAFWDMVAALTESDFEWLLYERTGWTPEEFFEAWKGSLWSIAIVSSLVSGFGVFQLMAVLAVWGYLKKRRRGQRVMRRWQAEEDAEDAEPEIVFPWELEDQEGPYPWEEEDDR